MFLKFGLVAGITLGGVFSTWVGGQLGMFFQEIVSTPDPWAEVLRGAIEQVPFAGFAYILLQQQQKKLEEMNAKLGTLTSELVRQTTILSLVVREKKD